MFSYDIVQYLSKLAIRRLAPLVHVMSALGDLTSKKKTPNNVTVIGISLSKHLLHIVKYIYYVGC